MLKAKTADNTLEKASNDELKNLKEKYDRLSYLLNRDNQNDSLAYYISSNDINNPNLKQVLNEIELNLFDIEEILDR